MVVFYCIGWVAKLNTHVVLVTGSTGFVGKALTDELLLQGYHVVASVRHSSDTFPPNVKQVNVGDLLPSTNWMPALKDVEVVIHLAARVHVMNDSASDQLKEFRKINTLATLNLAKQSVEAGVKRFIFVSSIKVNGEMTEPKHPFTTNDDYIPIDPYGLSKYEAEQGLLALAKETGMEVVIIRPPLIYGPGVKANFSSMMKWVYKGVPLPLGAIHNQRSLVALENMVSFIIHCISHPKAINEVFLISDGEDVSTTELLHKIAKAFGKRTLLFSVPTSLIRYTAKLFGKGDVVNRLCGSLQVDSSKARNLLGWQPTITMDEQLNKTVEAYLNEKTL